jgi:DNA-binding IclR family transcriptional regulator
MPRFRVSSEFDGSGGEPGAPASAASGGGRSAPGGTQSTQRLLALLDQFSTAHPTHTVEGLSEAIGVPRSTVYRLVSLLKVHELLEQAGESRYQLGPKAIMMGYVARSTVDLADIWRPALEQLAGASRETALVLRRIGDAAVCVDRVECDHPVRLSFDVGKAMPLHTGAGAKVLLACSPAEVRDRYIDEAVPAAQQARLLVEVAAIAARGWGESRAEVDPGIWAVAGPILRDRDGRCLAISVAVPEYRLEPGRREELIAQTKDVAEALRARLSQYV